MGKSVKFFAVPKPGRDLCYSTREKMVVSTESSVARIKKERSRMSVMEPEGVNGVREAMTKNEKEKCVNVGPTSNRRRRGRMVVEKDLMDGERK